MNHLKIVLRKVTHVGNYPNWFNGSIIKIVKEKKSAWKKYSKTKSPDDYLTFKTLRTQLKSKIKDAYKLYLQRMNYCVKLDPKRFWAFINSKKKIRPFSTEYDVQRFKPLQSQGYC